MRRILIAAALVCVAIGTLVAGQNGTYPVMESIAKKVILKYQMSTCGELIASKQKAPTAAEAATMEKAIGELKKDPNMRKAFIDMVASPMANKMFECGMIP